MGPTEKSEPRLSALARQLVLLVELRKGEELEKSLLDKIRGAFTGKPLTSAPGKHDGMERVKNAARQAHMSGAKAFSPTAHPDLHQAAAFNLCPVTQATPDNEVG